LFLGIVFFISSCDKKEKVFENLQIIIQNNTDSLIYIVFGRKPVIVI